MTVVELPSLVVLELEAALDLEAEGAFSPSAAGLGSSVRALAPLARAVRLQISALAQIIPRMNRAAQAQALKYAGELGKCADQPCPKPKKFRPVDRASCYRIMRAADADDADFVPLPLTPRGQAEGGERKCEAWALSFFDSAQSVQAKWNSLNERVDAAALYGTHAGEVDLTAADGLSSEPSKAGHISLHEFASAPSFKKRVKRAFSLVPQSNEDRTASADACARTEKAND